jgi:phytanoyl-CoA hydroxylase
VTTAETRESLEPHPWNTGFAWTDHRGPYRTITDEQADAFDRDGFFLYESAFDQATIEEILGEIDRVERRMEDFLKSQPDSRLYIGESGAITFTTHFVRRSERLRELVASPPLVDLAADLCGADVRLYWDQAVYKKPEKPRRFPWHQDNGYAFVVPQQYLTCWIALTDATADNGCPIVAPGLHRRGTLRHRYVDPLGWECIEGHPDARPVGARAGDIVVFSSLTPHLTGPNLTDAVRKAWIVQYCPEGATVLQGDPAVGDPDGDLPAANTDRQFLVVRDGEPVAPPPIPPREDWT